MAKAFIPMLKLPVCRRRTVTFDNGTEFAQHELMQQQTGACIDFAHPYCVH